jgi:hypothetical protein
MISASVPFRVARRRRGQRTAISVDRQQALRSSGQLPASLRRLAGGLRSGSESGADLSANPNTGQDGRDEVYRMNDRAWTGQMADIERQGSAS